MFSVIIPVYNGARFIDTAISCVFAQTYDSWEIIIINDGSTDNTAAMLEKYMSNPRITVYTQENAGASAARNKGIELARYEYITFLDVDDLWKENHLEIMAEMIQKYPTAGMYCTFGETQLVNGSVISECNYFKNKPETVLAEDFLAEYAADKSAKMYNICSTCTTKTAAKRAGGFPENCKIGEDLEFSLRIAAYYPVVLTKRATTVYQKANSSATRDNSFDPDWHFFSAVEELYSDPEISDERKANLFKVMQWFTVRRSRHYMIEGKRKEAAAALKSVGKTELKKDVFITKLLLLLPCSLVKTIFRIRWRANA